MKERHRREKFWSFFSNIVLKQNFKWKIMLIDEQNQGIFFQSQGIFFQFPKKGKRHLSPFSR